MSCFRALIVDLQRLAFCRLNVRGGLVGICVLFSRCSVVDIRLNLVLLLYIHSLTRSLLLMTSRILVNF